MLEHRDLETPQDHGALDASFEERFGRILRILSELLGTQAVVCFRSGGQTRLLTSSGTVASEWLSESALCAHVLVQDDLLIVPDVAADPVFSDHPAARRPPAVRFFAGHPLRDPEGERVGALCALDVRTRELSEGQVAVIRDLAALAEQQLADASSGETRRRLEASQQRLRAVIDSNPDAVYTIDPEGRIVACNDAVVRLTGYSREELEGSSFVPLIAPEDQAQVQEKVARCLAGEPQYSTARALRRDGSDYFVSLSAAPYTVGGECLGLIGVSRDITAQVEAERRLDLALETSRQGVWEWDVAEQVTYQSPQLRRLLGAPGEEVWESAADWTKRVHTDDFPEVYANAVRLFEGQAEYQGECRLRCENGKYRWFRYHGKVIQRDTDGKPLRVVGTTTDVHDWWLSERERQRDAERIALAVRAGGVGTFEFDLERSRVLRWDVRMSELYGLAPSEAPPALRSLLEACHPEDRERMLALRARLHSGEEQALDNDFRVVWPDGSVHHLRALGTVLRSGAAEPRVLVGTCWEVTEARELERRLSFQAMHDALTGLYNRTEFERRLRHASLEAPSSGRTHTLCFIDLDRFKLVNDTAGHEAGDALLREVGMLLASSVRGADVVARLGGDEFGLLLSDCAVEQAERVAEDLITRIGGLRFRWNGAVYDVGASMGLASLTDDGTATVAEVMSQADVACYAAKAAGRSRVMIYRPQQSEAQERHRELHVAATLREALEAGRFCLFAQAIVPSKPEEGAPPHYELLVRMHALNGEFVSPGVFIPAAERYDLMAQIDRWVLREALERHAEQLASVPGLSISLNVSAQSLNDPGFVPFIRGLLQTSPLPPDRVHFEITETAVVTHLSIAGKVVEALRGLGCAVALDDFGSGLSSFNYLKHFPVDYVKIDGSFIRALDKSEADRMIVDSIHDLAHKFGARTVAEYVENAEILSLVREIGVDYAQGYGIGKPLPLTQVLKEAL